jgi:hypothetical protein
VSALISVKVAPVSFWPAAGRYQLQTMAATQRVNCKKRFSNDLLPVRCIIDEAFKSGVIIQVFALRITECHLPVMETAPGTLLKINIYYCPGKVEGLPAW